MPEPVIQRIVPGAPPPTPLSKTQKKKRKAKGKSDNDDTPATPTTAATPLVEKIAETPEVRESSLAPELVNRSESQATPLPEEDVLFKPSPIVDLVHKRLKATTKKISRITIYAATDSEKLNDDQKRTLKTLPTLEAVQKELGEVKKAIEVHEAELVQELTAKRHEADKAEKARIADAVSSAEAALVSKTNGVLDLLRLRSSLASGLVDISSNVEAVEIAALISVADALVGEDEERKQTTVKSLLFGQDVDGISSSRLLEISHLAFNSPRAPTPPAAEEEEAEEEEHPTLAESATTDFESVAGAVPPSAGANTLHFMQASELETPSFEEGVEFIEKADAAGHEEPAANGHAAEEPDAAPADVTNGPIDWAADDEGGLPSIAGLQAEFGTSGSVTPAIQEEAAAAAPDVNGHVEGETEQPEDDGFTQARGRGGRGGRGGHRGGDRGGHRGGERGGYRGGDRGGFRGGDRGGYRGGEGRGGHRGGERGGFRGGDRGGFRGGERGGFRGGERGGFSGRGSGGEWRGEGRGGRGRGRGGDRGGAPATPTTPAA
ncbi:hypothetical protein GALMADRAFT_268537 [Galerina marginata CBS 339.88]|uniref:Uncharacterized protein n=1 Tax=Galerina marginata (strain CBS 339.88) TaxID=685588 RepID=A0A067T7P6_GALM3|nr:hypothetical protein GALMADRAFT_268537 [Galerina marginata CBS 339.88]